MPAIHLQLAKSLLSKNSPMRAVALCEDTRERFGDAAFNAAFAQIFLGQNPLFIKERQRVLKNALHVAPEDPRLLRELGWLAYLDGNDGNAVNYLRQASQQLPNDESLVSQLLPPLRRSGHDIEADSALADWSANHPQSLLAYRSRVESQLTMDSPAALSLIDDALATFPDDGELHAQKARLLHRLDRDDDAQAEFIASSKFSPDSADAQIETAHFLLTVRQDGEAALPCYIAAYFLNPNARDWATAADHIRTLAPPATTETLDQLLDADRPFATVDLIKASTESNQPLPVSSLWRAATDDVPEIRSAAVAALATIKSDSFTSALPALLNAADPWKRAAAGQIAIKRGCSIDQLDALLRDSQANVRFECAEQVLLDGNHALQPRVEAHVQSGEPDPFLKDELAALIDATH